MAGAVAVLLDPDHPIDRLRHQLDDAEVRIILTTREPPAGLEDLEIDWVYLDPEREEFTGLPARPLERGPSLDDPMYVVFTSGSTGRPKGVEVAHRSVANLVTDAVTRYGLGPGDRVLQFASPGFDTLIEELLPALNAGALIVHRPRGRPPASGIPSDHGPRPPHCLVARLGGRDGACRVERGTRGGAARHRRRRGRRGREVESVAASYPEQPSLGQHLWAQ